MRGFIPVGTNAKRENTRGEKINQEHSLFSFFFRRACSRASRSPNAQAPVVQAIGDSYARDMPNILVVKPVGLEIVASF